MSNSPLPISNLPNVQSTGLTPSDLLVIVNYDVPSGTTKNITTDDFKTYITSGITNSFTGGTISGSTEFTNGLTANTLSVNGVSITGDTYVTGGTYSAGTIDFNYNSGGGYQVIGLYTGQTSYVNSLNVGIGLSGNSTTGNITIVNTDPDQIVTISGGTDIEVVGTYPNFGVNFTGQTTFDYLPLSGGTVTGDTIFTSGLTANTLSVNGVSITGDTYVTGGTYFSGGTIVFDYSTGSNFQVTGLTEDLNNEIAGLAETDEETIELNLTTNKIQLKETVASATGGTRTFQGDFAISGGTLNLDTIGSGSPIINLGLDSSGEVVTGTTDQTVTITGGTSIEIVGSYPDFGINYTGQTTFDYLPLSGGTVTGDTIFTSGLTANTISATTYQNLPVSGLTGGSNINVSGSSGNFTISVTGITSGSSVNPYNNSGSGTTISWDVSGTSTNYEATLTATTTLNLTNVRNGDFGTIIIRQDGVGGRTLTLGTVNGSSTTHRVANGGGGSIILTSNASAIDILTFTYNGSIMFWTVGNDYT
jgi:enamine deaminase RidA (YjgF/YER057c/UK114 family)